MAGNNVSVAQPYKEATWYYHKLFSQGLADFIAVCQGAYERY